ncbi:ATP-grasp domain-containing protein [Pirellulaceae bacterium SH449]
MACSAEVIDLSDTSWIKALGPSARVILAGGLEDSVESLELLSEIDPTIIPEQYRQMRDWRNWREWALGSGLQFPATYTLDDWQNAHTLDMIRHSTNESRTSQRWLWKNLRSGGGLGISFLDSKDMADLDRLKTRHVSKPGILQEYVSGKPLGISFLSSNHGTLILGIAESVPHEPHIWSDFIYRGSIAPVPMPDWFRVPIRNFASAVARDTNWRGIWQADFLLAGNKLYLLEINPRWTASMELISYGYDLSLVTWHISCAQLEKSEWHRIHTSMERAQKEQFSKFRKDILYATEDRSMTAKEAEEWWGRRWFARENEKMNSWYADIPQVHEKLHEGAPIHSLIERLV